VKEEDVGDCVICMVFWIMVMKDYGSGMWRKLVMVCMEVLILNWCGRMSLV
jgi:hypothetical protein